MEFRQVIISQNNSSDNYIFNNKVNLVTSTVLSDELLKENYNLGDSPFVISSSNNLALKDTFQIKIRIQDAGIMMVYFDNVGFEQEKKEQLLNEIKTLKDGVTPTQETQANKIVRVLEIIGPYQPLFVAYLNRGEFIYTSSSLNELLKDKELDFPLLLLIASLNYVDSPSKTKDGKPVKEKKVKKVSNEKFSYLEAFKSIDFIFFGIFAMFIAFGSVISGFEIKNGEGIAVFLIVLSVAFFFVLTYAVYKTYKDDGLFQYKIKNMVAPVVYIIIGIALGIVIGYLITTFVMKPKEVDGEPIEVNIPLLLVIGGLIALGASSIALALPIPLKKLFKKLNRKNQ